jgi:hypothetical protein
MLDAESAALAILEDRENSKLTRSAADAQGQALVEPGAMCPGQITNGEEES